MCVSYTQEREEKTARDGFWWCTFSGCTDTIHVRPRKTKGLTHMQVNTYHDRFTWADEPRSANPRAAMRMVIWPIGTCGWSNSRRGEARMAGCPAGSKDPTESRRVALTTAPRVGPRPCGPAPPHMTFWHLPAVTCQVDLFINGPRGWERGSHTKYFGPSSYPSRT